MASVRLFGETQDRRSFLRALAVAGGAAMTAGRTATLAAQHAGVGRGPADDIGVQLYTVRDRMQKDFTGTLERVAGIGYREVEFAGYFGHSPEDVRALLDRLELRSPSTHIMLPELQKDLAAQIRSARTVGHEYITVPALMEALSGTVDADYWARTAAEFNRVAGALKAEGLGFAYHNHNFEFAPLPGGRTGYDVLLAETDPSLVKFELDLLWATFAGQDPVELFRKSPGRFVMWHVKDMKGLREAQSQAAAAQGAMAELQAASPHLTAVGTGELDFRRIFAAAQTAGMRYFFVENDAAPETESSLADIETSYRNLKQLLA